MIVCSPPTASLYVSASVCVYQVQFSNVSLYIYSSNDIVSNELKGGGWEATEIKEMLWGIKQCSTQREILDRLGTQSQGAHVAVTTAGQRQLKQQQQQQQAASPRQPLFVDVGSNVGWFAMNAAAAGAKVAAFEGEFRGVLALASPFFRRYKASQVSLTTRGGCTAAAPTALSACGDGR